MVETFTVGGKKYITISKREGDKVTVTDVGKQRLAAAKKKYTSTKGIVAPKPKKFYFNPKTGTYSTTPIKGQVAISRAEAIKKAPPKPTITKKIVDAKRERQLTEQQRRTARVLTEEAQRKRYGTIIYAQPKKEVPKKVIIEKPKPIKEELFAPFIPIKPTLKTVTTVPEGVVTPTPDITIEKDIAMAGLAFAPPTPVKKDVTPGFIPFVGAAPEEPKTVEEKVYGPQPEPKVEEKSPERLRIEAEVERLKTKSEGKNIIEQTKTESQNVITSYQRGEISSSDANRIIEELNKQQTDKLKTFETRQEDINQIQEKFERKYEGVAEFVISPEGIKIPGFMSNQRETDWQELKSQQQALNEDIYLSGLSPDKTPEQFIQEKKKTMIDIALDKKIAEGIIKTEREKPTQLEMLKLGIKEVYEEEVKKPSDIVYKALLPGALIAAGVMTGISKTGKVVKKIGEKTPWRWDEKLGRYIEEKPVTVAGIAGVSTLVAAPFGIGVSALGARLGISAASPTAAKLGLVGAALVETGLEAKGVTWAAKKMLVPKDIVLTPEEFSIIRESPDFDRTLLTTLQRKGYEGKELMNIYNIEKRRKEAIIISQVAPQLGIGVSAEKVGRMLTKGMTAKQILSSGGFFKHATMQTKLGRSIGLAGVIEGSTQEVIAAEAEDRKISPLRYVGYGAAGGLGAGAIGGLIGRGSVATTTGGKILGGTTSKIAHIIDPFEKWSDEIATATGQLASKLNIRVFTPKTDIGKITATTDNRAEKLFKLENSYLRAVNPNEKQAALNLYVKLGGDAKNLVGKEQFGVKPIGKVLAPPKKEVVVEKPKALVPIVEKPITIVTPKKEMIPEKYIPVPIEPTLPIEVPISPIVPVPISPVVPVPVTPILPVKIPVDIRKITPGKPYVPTYVVPVAVAPFGGLGVLPGQEGRRGRGIPGYEYVVENPLKDYWTPFIQKQKAKDVYEMTGAFKPEDMMPQISQQQMQMPNQLGRAALPNIMTGMTGVNMNIQPIMQQPQMQQQFMFGQQKMPTQHELNVAKTQVAFDRMLGKQGNNFQQEFGAPLTGRRGATTQFGRYSVNKEMVKSAPKQQSVKGLKQLKNMKPMNTKKIISKSSKGLNTGKTFKSHKKSRGNKK